ncbi:MAG: hypothetical protein H6694_03285 [Candidatus Latescibacteria bacterium]|nr:hypothetical protein [Candidatus Latescibacterota bacterium]
MTPSRPSPRAALLGLAALCLAALPAVAGSLRLMDYNLLNFPGSTGASRAPYFRTVLAEAAPDLIVAEEVLGTAGRDQFLSLVLDVAEPGLWEAAFFHDGTDTDRALFIRDSCAAVIDAGWLDTDLRDIDWWDLRLTESGDTLRVYGLHLKASQGSTEEQRRYAECLVLRGDLDALPPQRAALVCGDYNIYTYTEPAWQLLRSDGPGQLLDPLDQEGPWHNNLAYAPVHTQSTRTASFGGGATGGLDDRFDFILPRPVLMDGIGLELDPLSYLVLGNDGNHFNQAIIDGVNGVVSAEVANALHESSDHLPLLVNLTWQPVTTVATAPAPARLDAWPNPFNPATRLAFGLPAAGHARLAVYDALGRQVALLVNEALPAGPLQVDWHPTGLPAGLYLAELRLDGAPAARTKLVLLK